MGHSHEHVRPGKVGGKNLAISIILNVVITTAQVIGGLLSGSLSLLSDAVHNFTDVLSLIVSYIANRLAGRKASLSKTFGYKRAEILAAFVNAVSLIIIAVLLLFEAYKRFRSPEVIDSGLVIGLALLGIVVNGLSVWILREDAQKNINMRSAYLHLFTDMLASFAVLAGGVLMYYFQMYWVDAVLTAVISMYLIYVGYDLLRASTRMLMLFTPEHIDIHAIVKKVDALPGVRKLHHVHVWCLNDDEFHLEAHLDVKEDLRISDFNLLQLHIEELLKKEFGINHVNIQPEYKKQDPKDLIVQD